MRRLQLHRFLLGLVLAVCLPVSAHAGFIGNTVSGSFFSGGAHSPDPLNFGSATVGAGVEFTGTATDVFGQIWTISVDLFNNGLTLKWTESTRAGQPNGGNISDGTNRWGIDLTFSSPIDPSLALSSYMTSYGTSTPYAGTSNMDTFFFPTANSVHIGFHAMLSTDTYTFTTAEAVPAPASVALLGLGLGLFGFRRARRTA